MANYVKFMRGTPEAYLKATKDQDTLYFISETNSSEGILYLGTKVIGGSSSIDFNNFSIDALKDVLITEELTDKSFLVYQADTQNWINVNFEELKFIGATDSSSGVSGFVPAPEQGETNLFLRSDGKWISISNDNDLSDIYNSINTLEESVNGLKEVVGNKITNTGLFAELNKKANKTDIYLKPEIDTKINEAIAAADHLKRIVVQSIEEIDLTAIDAEKYIYLLSSGNSEVDNKYYEYMVVKDSLGNKTVEKVGSWEVNLSDYVKKEDLLITSVNENNFQIISGELNLTTINIAQVNNLENILNTKLSFTEAENNFVKKLFFESTVGNLTTLIDNNSKDIDLLKEKLTWQNLDNN